MGMGLWHVACLIRSTDGGQYPGNDAMFGLITRKDLIIHPVTICRCYGWRVLVVGLLLHRGTFLDLVTRRGAR